MVEIKTGSRIRIWQTFGEFTGMSSQIHVPHCRMKEFHPPYCKLFFAIFYFFCGFLNVIWAFVSSGFRIVSDTLVTFVTVCETVIAIVNNLSE